NRCSIRSSDCCTAAQPGLIGAAVPGPHAEVPEAGLPPEGHTREFSWKRSNKWVLTGGRWRYGWPGLTVPFTADADSGFMLSARSRRGKVSMSKSILSGAALMALLMT